MLNERHVDPERSMDVDDIKRAIVDLDLQAVGRAIGEQSTGAGRAQDTVLTTTKQVIGWAGVSVCEASLSDWKHYVAVAQQLNQPNVLHSRAMEWRNGAIYIFEMLDEPHYALVSATEAAIFAPTSST
jgi:hypothetical protein